MPCVKSNSSFIETTDGEENGCDNISLLDDFCIDDKSDSDSNVTFNNRSNSDIIELKEVETENVFSLDHCSLNSMVKVVNKSVLFDACFNWFGRYLKK